MWAGNLVRARLLARKGIVDPTDFTSLLAWRLESNVSDVPDVPDAPADKYSWEGVAYHINKGTYKDVYAIGDMIPLDLGSEGIINMQIAAFDADTLADGSGTAAISWVGKELLKTNKRWNSALKTNNDGTRQEGTGTIGGWEKSEMRAYFNNTIQSLISASVRTHIVAVTKTQPAYDASGLKFTQVTEDDFWMPSVEEVSADGVYCGLFSDSEKLKKKRCGDSEYYTWWTRSAGAEKFVRTVYSVGTISTTGTAADSKIVGICIGFCTGRTPT